MATFSDPYDDATYIASQVGTQVPAGTLENIDVSEGVTLPLNGSSQYVTFADNPSWESDTDGTIAVWIYMTSFATNNNIFTYSDSATATSRYNFLVDTSGQLVSNMRRTTGNTYILTSVATLSLHRWYHVAVASGGSTTKMYINGSEQTDAVVSGAGTGAAGDWLSEIADTPELASIGVQRTSAISNYFAGTIDDFRLYSTVLSTGTIFSLAQAGIEPGSETVHLKYNEGTGTAIDDTGSAGTDGTAVGTPTWTTTHKQPFTQRSKTISTAIVDGASAIATVKKTATKKPGGSNQRLSVSSNGADWTNSAGENTTNAGGRYFDGVDDYCTVADHADFDITVAAITLCGWVYLDNYTATSSYVSKWNTSQKSYALFSAATTGLLTFSATSDGSTSQTFTSSMAIPLNRWTFVAATLSGTAVTLFVDGESQVNGSTFTGTTMHSGTASINIGSQIEGTSKFLAGKLDDVRIYSEALSVADLYALFTKHTQPSATNLQGHWKFDGDLLDSSGNSHTLTNSGSLSVTDWEKLPSFGEADLERVNVLPFDGVSTHVTMADDPAWESDSAGSISVVVKFDDLSIGGNFFVYGLSSSNDYWLSFHSIASTGQIRFWVRSNTSVNQARIESSITVETGKYYHIMITSNGTDTWVLYVNGVEDTGVTLVKSGTGIEGHWLSDIAGSPDRPTIGASRVNSTTSGWFAGTIASANLWNDVRTKAETIAECEAGYVIDLADAALRFAFSFDEGTGTALDNAEGTAGYDGTLVNSAGWEKDIYANAGVAPTQQSADVSGLSLTTIYTRLENTNQILGGEVLTEQSVDYTAGGNPYLIPLLGVG